MANNNEPEGKRPFRGVLYNFLNNECTTIERWHQPFFDWADAADLLGVPTIGELPKPYGVILMDDEEQSGSLNIGYFQGIEIWPYFEPGNYLPVDKAQSELVRLLNRKLITVNDYDGNPQVYKLEYLGSGRDYHDTELRAITRRLEFRTPRVR